MSCGALVLDGSLSTFGALSECGSLADLGSLEWCGSLSLSGALQGHGSGQHPGQPFMCVSKRNCRQPRPRLHQCSRSLWLAQQHRCSRVYRLAQSLRCSPDRRLARTLRCSRSTQLAPVLWFSQLFRLLLRFSALLCACSIAIAEIHRASSSPGPQQDLRPPTPYRCRIQQQRSHSVATFGCAPSGMKLSTTSLRPCSGVNTNAICPSVLIVLTRASAYIASVGSSSSNTKSIVSA